MSDSTAIVVVYMEKAERALGEAQFLLRAGKTEGACSRGYYAMFDAAHAALFATGNETPEAIVKTHHNLIAEFGKKIVLGGQIDGAHGRALNKVRDVRLLADYSAAPPSLEDARWVVEQAAAFVAAVRSLIEARKP